MKILFLDESGDHNLSVIDASYPLFVLGGIILDKVYAEEELVKKFENFKLNLFGTKNIILHTADITRNKNGFEKLVETPFRDFFYRKLNDLISELEFKVVACVIKKNEHLSRYGLAALDPYFLSLDILVERFCMEINNNKEGGIIIAERRNPTLDRQLDLAWSNLKIQGTQYIRSKQIKSCISALQLKVKNENVAGLQLADLVVTPIGRYILGKEVKKDFQIIKNKFRCGKNGEWKGYGLIVLPKPYKKKADTRYAVVSL